MKKLVRYTQLEAPAELPITLAEVWAQCRIDPEGSPYETPEDALLLGYMTTALQWVDGPMAWLGRCILSQKWSIQMESWPLGRELRVPLPRLISVESVKYLDLSETEQTLDPTLYRAIPGEPGAILLKLNQLWPIIACAPDAVRLEVTCGWGAPDEVPAPIKQALLLLVAQWHENREPVAFAQPAELPFAVSALLSTYQYFGDR